ncbi:MAG: iron-sulfur cluster assembly accessory protein [Candidatus Zixiibacteriota bacterium]
MLQQSQINTTENILTMTPSAVVEAKRLMALEDKPGLFLRFGVTTGGCSGFSYSMMFDDQASDLDREFEFDGLKVRVDLKALMYLKGSVVDYESGLLGGGFKFSNPNAKRSCGCGSSFTC